MVKYELLKGTTAASVVLDTATRKGYDPDKAEVKDVADIGVSLATVADVEKLLDGVDLENSKSIFMPALPTSLFWLL